MQIDTILHGDALAMLRSLPDGSIQTCVTSPPYYGLRDYGVPGQLGLEATPAEYVAHMVEVFREVRRVLRADGTCWLNLGDSYAGGGGFAPNAPSNSLEGRSRRGARDCIAGRKRGGIKPQGAIKPKDLIGIPWRVAFALQDDGWYLRSDIIWAKSNPMPESVTDRPTRAHEYIFLLAKSERYYYDANAIKEPSTYAGKVVKLGPKSLSKGQARGANVKANGNALADSVTVTAMRNKRTVWNVATAPCREAHFATFPPKLIEPCILAGTPSGGIILDPFFGAGTVGMVARRHSRHYIGIELNPAYIEIAERRIAGEVQPVLWSA